MGVLGLWRSHRGAPHMRHNCARIGARGRFSEVFALKGGPSLLADVGRTVGIGRYPPSVTVAQPGKVLPALRHQRVLRVHERALDLRLFIGVQAVKATHPTTLP